MTAINPAKLKVQAAELGQLLAEPERFISQAHDLLAFYSSRIRQTSLSRTPLTLRSYQSPAPVLRALELEIKAAGEADPSLGFQLSDTLWQERWVEFRQLAVFTLSCLPPDNPQQILSRVNGWLEDCTTENIRRLVMTHGLQKLAAEKPASCLSYLEELIASETKANQQAALFGLELFAANENFLNLPLIYKLLARILRSQESGLVKEITTLSRLLISRSEQEAAYFLINQLGEGIQPRISRITRQLLPHFSTENQRLIKAKLGNLQR